jgi:ABC-type nitrate/sulfonate/bicarbonate transport system substrate-binding protein
MAATSRRSAQGRGAATRAVIGLSWADETQLILASPNRASTSVRDLKGRRFGLPNWKTCRDRLHPRPGACAALRTRCSLEGLKCRDVEMVDQDIESHYSDGGARPSTAPLPGMAAAPAAGAPTIRKSIALLRGEVDAIFLKGAHGAQVAHQFGLTTVIDTGAHPEPLIRANNGTPRTLAVDGHLLDNHFDAAVTIVEQVLRAEAWAQDHPDVRRYLARETNASEYWVSVAYGSDAQTKLKTDLAEQSLERAAGLHRLPPSLEVHPASFDVRNGPIRPLEAAQSTRIAV